MNDRQGARQGEGAQNIFADDYDLRQFWRDLSCGQLRWLAAMLSAANVGLLALFATDAEGATISFPFRMEGAPVWILFTLTLAAWLALAALNWKAWLAKKQPGV